MVRRSAKSSHMPLMITFELGNQQHYPTTHGWQVCHSKSTYLARASAVSYGPRWARGCSGWRSAVALSQNHPKSPTECVLFSAVQSAASNSSCCGSISQMPRHLQAPLCTAPALPACGFQPWMPQVDTTDLSTTSFSSIGDAAKR